MSNCELTELSLYQVSVYRKINTWTVKINGPNLAELKIYWNQIVFDPQSIEPMEEYLVCRQAWLERERKARNELRIIFYQDEIPFTSPSINYTCIYCSARIMAKL